MDFFKISFCFYSVLRYDSILFCFVLFLFLFLLLFFFFNEVRNSVLHFVRMSAYYYSQITWKKRASPGIFISLRVCLSGNEVNKTCMHVSEISQTFHSNFLPFSFPDFVYFCLCSKPFMSKFKSSTVASSVRFYLKPVTTEALGPRLGEGNSFISKSELFELDRF